MNPVPVMQLVEVARGVHTSQQTFEAAKGLAEFLGKQVCSSQDRPVSVGGVWWCVCVRRVCVFAGGQGSGCVCVCLVGRGPREGRAAGSGLGARSRAPPPTRNTQTQPSKRPEIAFKHTPNHQTSTQSGLPRQPRAHPDGQRGLLLPHGGRRLRGGHRQGHAARHEPAHGAAAARGLHRCVVVWGGVRAAAVRFVIGVGWGRGALRVFGGRRKGAPSGRPAPRIDSQTQQHRQPTTDKHQRKPTHAKASTRASPS